MFVALHRSHRDRATGEPRAMQFFQRTLASDEAAESGGIAENFIERECDEVGMVKAQIEAVGGDEGGGVQQHIPTFGVGDLDPFK